MLYGTSVILRRMTATDLDYLANFNQQPEVVALTGGKYLPTTSQQQPVSEVVGNSRSRRRWAIMTSDLEIIGEIEFDHILWQRHEAELAICISRKEYWSLGLGKDAIQTLLRHAFGELGLKSVYLRVFGDNLRAIRAYEHCGFRKVGAIQIDEHPGQCQQVVLMETSSTEHRVASERMWNQSAPQREPAV